MGGRFDRKPALMVHDKLVSNALLAAINKGSGLHYLVPSMLDHYLRNNMRSDPEQSSVHDGWAVKPEYVLPQTAYTPLARWRYWGAPRLVKSMAQKSSASARMH